MNAALGGNDSEIGEPDETEVQLIQEDIARLSAERLGFTLVVQLRRVNALKAQLDSRIGWGEADTIAIAQLTEESRIVRTESDGVTIWLLVDDDELATHNSVLSHGASKDASYVRPHAQPSAAARQPSNTTKPNLA